MNDLKIQIKIGGNKTVKCILINKFLCLLKLYGLPEYKIYWVALCFYVFFFNLSIKSDVT